jgi:hypothetical protein
MGGNALKEVKTRRVLKEEYEEIRGNVLDVLRYAFPTVRCTDLPAYRTKESFGDLDILLEIFPGDETDYLAMIQYRFNPQQIVRNDKVYSFDVNDFQVDLILTPTEDYDTALAYYAWNDIGNLAGRIFKKLGFKYGHRGLSYMFRKNDNAHSVFAETIVSRDTKAIFEFGDLNYDVWLAGFDTVDDMFVWVSSSKYFHKSIYLLMNRNHVSRTRDKKRKIYNQFLKWCEETDGLPAYPWLKMREQDGYKGDDKFLQEALRKFPGFAETRSKILQDQLINERGHEKLNGVRIASLTGIAGSELGEFMADFFHKYGTRTLMNVRILHWTQEQVDDMILEHWKSYDKDPK